ncbi:hypothetical protein [Saccharothrix coeruleofusca]|uniref:hypothetical protein n=1 Tax=Saccharothrix coeruleofusca TaxID=33919 RepID=UPI0016708BB0|nr:hypothetical protein [Saccharothrix coeruleofusca]
MSRRQEEISSSPDYHGCPMVAVAAELKDTAHPASTVARRHKQDLTDFFRAEAERAGVADPDTLAAQLTIVFDGASAHSVVRAEPLGGLGLRAATALLDTAGVPCPRAFRRPDLRDHVAG